jgi:hypothetical protein
MTQKMHSSDQHSQERTAGKQTSPASVQPVETEDSSTAGDKRAEQQRVLRHNVETGQHQRHPEEVAAQHAIGSFTGGKGSGKK